MLLLLFDFFKVIYILVSFSSKFNEFDNDFWLQVTCCKVFSNYLKFAVFWIRNILVCVFSQWYWIRRITSKSRYLDRMQKNKDQNKQNIWIRTLFEQCNSPEFIRCFIDTWNASKLIMHKISENAILVNFPQQLKFCVDFYISLTCLYCESSKLN